jgi:hypothetical protein
MGEYVYQMVNILLDSLEMTKLMVRGNSIPKIIMEKLLEGYGKMVLCSEKFKEKSGIIKIKSKGRKRKAKEMSME